MRIRSLPALAGLTCAASTLVSCDATPAAAPTHVARDSAGVEIVESSGPAWADDEAWTVGTEPLVQIGVVEGEEPYQFSTIAGMVRTPDGGFVVADFRAADVRFFGPDGGFRGSFGGFGDGPGEFRRINRIRRYLGDSIAVMDQMPGRVTLADPEGRIGRVLMLDIPEPQQPSGQGMALSTFGGVAGPLGDGSFLASPPMVIQGTPGERVRTETEFIRYSAAGDSLGAFGPFGSEITFPNFESPQFQLGLPSPYEVQRTFDSTADHLYVGSSDEIEIQVFGLDGGLERLIRASDRDLTLTDEHRTIYRDHYRISLSDADPQRLEAALAAVEFPDRIPPYIEILTDSEDHLWVRHYKIRFTSGPETWSVFAPEGHLLGTVRTPEALQVREIGPDYILGIWTDELDVRYLRMYSLDRG